MGKTKDGLRILDHLNGDSPKLHRRLERERQKCDIAQQVYDARCAAALTQLELAKRVGIGRDVIARLEDADYEGHSLRLLRRIAKEVGCSVHVEFRRDRAVVAS